MDKEGQEGEGAGKGGESVAEVEAGGLAQARGVAVGPGVAAVPGEVMKEGELEGGGGGEEVMVGEEVVEEAEGGELDGSAEETDEVEAEKAGEGHGVWGWRVLGMVAGAAGLSAARFALRSR